MAAYPQKQTVLIFALCVLAVTGVAFYTRGGFVGFTPAHESQTSELSPVPEGTLHTFTSKEDWRKQFLAGSTTSAAFSAPKQFATREQSEKLTATDQLGRDFMTKFAELRSAGLTSDEKSVQNVMGQVAAQSISTLPQPKSYTFTDIQLSDNTKTSLTAYGSAVVRAFQKYMPSQNEAEIANNAFASNDTTKLKTIDPIIANYRAMVRDLLALPVPPALARHHVSLLNGVSISLYNAEAFRHMDTDPLRGLAAVSLELVGMQNIITALNDIQKYFDANNVKIGS